MKIRYLVFALAAICFQSGFCQPVKKVLLEDFTVNWSGWSTRGFSVRDSIVNANNGNVIPVSLHYLDPLANAQSEAIADAFGISAFPTGMVDRNKFNGQLSTILNTDAWGSSVNNRLATAPALSIAITSNYDNNTRVSNVQVKTTFLTAKSSSMKVHLFYVEDSVINYGTAYDQQNNYGAGCSAADPQNAFYNYPCVINGFVYNNLFRYAATPVLGTAGVIPFNVLAGDTFSAYYSYTVPLSFNANRMKLVAFITNGNKSVLNAECAPLVDCICNFGASTAITNVTGTTCLDGKIKVNVSGTFKHYPYFELYDNLNNLISFYSGTQATTTYTFANLNASTYTVIVKDGLSCCALTLQNRTVKCAPPSVGLLANNTTATSANLNWNAVTCSVGYRVQYRASGTTNWTTKSATVNNKVITGLAPSTNYQWRVATKCTSSNPAIYSVYSAIQNFTTPALRQGEIATEFETDLPLANFNLFPNPASQLLDVSFNSAYQNAKLEVINLAGQTVIEKHLESDNENFNILIDLAALNSGIYSVVISNAGALQAHRFIKE